MTPGAGKAAASMAVELEAVWQAKQQQDLAPRPWSFGVWWLTVQHTAPCEHIEVIEAAHPVPDAMGLEVSQYAAIGEEWLERRRHCDLPYCRGRFRFAKSLPGGHDISLAEKQQINNKALLKSGATIDGDELIPNIYLQ